MLRALTVVLLANTPALAQGVLRVGPGRQFTDLQAAIDFAQAGDRILVDPGSYGSFLQDVTIRKGVRITGQPGVVVWTTVSISRLPLGETVTISGVEIRALSSPPGGMLPCVAVADCAGAVALDRCRFAGTPCFGCSLLSDPRLQVVRSSLVLASQCVFSPALVRPGVSCSASVLMLTDCGTLNSQAGLISRAGVNYYLPGGPGLECIQGSLVQTARTHAQGGPGLWAFLAPAGAGAVGVDVVGSELHMAGPATVTGGTGGDGVVQGPNPQGGTGGPGVQQNGTLFHDQGVSLVGGAGGQGAPPGVPGAPLTGTPATVVSLPSLATTTLQLPGGSFQLDGFAAPGSFLYLLVAFETSPMDVPGLRGRLAPRLDALLFIEGPIVVGGSGRVTRTFAIPPDPSLGGVVLFAQAAGIDPAAFPLAFLSAAVPMTVAF